MADHLNGKVAILVGASCVGPGWGNRSGAIANVSSVAAIRYTGYPYVACYAAKAAVNNFTMELGPAVRKGWDREHQKPWEVGSLGG